MATIRFKRGSTDPVVGIGPTGLTAGEPAFNSTDNKFFIHNGTTAIWVGAEIENTNANWSDGTVVPTKNAVNDLVSGAISGGGNLVNSINSATGDVTIADSGPGLLVDTNNKVIAITNTGVTSLTLSAASNKGLSISGAGTTGELTKSLSLDFANAAGLGGATLADKFFVGDASNSDAIGFTTIGTALGMISGDITVNSTSGVAAIGTGVIVNADINASAAIADTKLGTIATANKVSLTALNIDGGSDIGADLADADLIIVDDGGGGTNVKSAVSRIPTYVFSKVSGGDITINSSGEAAIGSGVIVDADINASAAISTSKLAANTISGVALGSNLNALTIGSGLGGAASYNGSSAVTITNEGVRSLTGTANEIEVSGSTGDITIGLPDNVTVGGNLSVVGNLTVNGTTTTVNSTTVAIQDPIFTLGGTAALGSDDNKDRGIEFRWHNGSSAKTGFFGFNDDVQRFTFIPDATNSSEVFSGTVGDVEIASVYFANNGNLGRIVPTTLTDTRTYTLPNESGTIITTAASGTLPIIALDIDGGADIGADLADADLIIVDDGGGGTNKRSAVSRIPTYVFSKVSGDITINSSGVAAIGSGVIVNADINDAAAIADTKLGTIATANKVSLSAIDLDGATETTSITGTDLLFVDDGADGTNKKVTVDNLFGSSSTAIIDGGSY